MREEFLVELDSLVEHAAGDALEETSTKTGPAPRRTRSLSREESYDRLDEWLEEAQAGAPDDWLAKQSNVALDAVLLWRKARNIRRASGRKRVLERNVWAVDAFGGKFEAPLHPAASDLDGLWEAPQYILRQPIFYRELCRQVWTLHVTLGVGPQLIASALGLRERDAELALVVWAGHLSRLGVSCRVCGELLDPRYGDTCSVRCAEES